MRKWFRILCLGLFLPLFVAAVLLSWRGTIESHVLRLAFPRLPGQTSYCWVVARAGTGQFGFFFSRTAEFDGVVWVRCDPPKSSQRIQYSRGTSMLLSSDPSNVTFSWAGFEGRWAKSVRFAAPKAPPPWNSMCISTTRHGLIVPFWFAILSTGLCAAYFVLAIRRDWRKPLSPTQCGQCGYDLRAGHDKCPECGGESHVKVGANNSTDNPSAPAVRR